MTQSARDSVTTPLPLTANPLIRPPWVWLPLGILLLDQATKLWVRQAIPLHAALSVFPFFSLTHVQNTGAAFGIFPDSNLFFIFSSLAILVVLYFFQKSLGAATPWGLTGLGLLWGGALGNLFDRVLVGSVTDFLDFYWKAWHWPSFNVADAGISVGVFLILLEGFINKPSGGKA